jgi:hypothetical protein
VPNGALSVTLENLQDAENGCENNGERDAEDPSRPRGAVGHAVLPITPAQAALDTDGVISPARCASEVATGGELSDLASLQWSWTEPMPDTTDCDALPQFGPGHPFVNAAPSQAISGLEGYTSAIETLAPGQGICVQMKVFMFDHPSRVWHANAGQGDTLDFDLRFDLVQAP